MRTLSNIKALGLALAIFAAPAQGHAISIDAMALEAHINTAFSKSKPDRALAKALVAFYEKRQFAPVWVDENGLNQSAQRLFEFFEKAHLEGLNPNNYISPEIDRLSSVKDDRFAIIRLETIITKLALKYARHISLGQFRPSSLSANFSTLSPKLTTADMLSGLGRTDHPGKHLISLAPAHDGYKRLRTALNKLLTLNVEWTKVPNIRRSIKPGQSHKNVALVRARLRETGDYKPAFAELISRNISTDAKQGIENPKFYDPGLAKAVKAFQKRHGIAAKGLINKQTIRSLNAPVSARIKQIIVNMERYRWLPRELGKRHVFVNQANYRMNVVDNGKLIHSARVIVGKPKHKTPIFSHEIRLVVFNPYWNVPRSIIKNEMIPFLKQDPSYLERQGYEVRTTTGRGFQRRGLFGWGRPEISERQIISVRQPPGPKNALGRVKFMFPNHHHIYLHDTPGKHLFRRSKRALSHGCVRVQDAYKFAEILLGLDAKWTPKQVRRAISVGTNRTVKLKTNVPVHLTYFTAWIDDDGNFNSRPDIYRRDPVLARSMTRGKLAMK